VAPVSEIAMERIVRELYLTPQQATAARVVREVIGRCRAEKLARRNCPSHFPTWLDAASRRCRTLIYDAAAASIRKQSRSSAQSNFWFRC
jgi:hypothetical protein